MTRLATLKSAALDMTASQLLATIALVASTLSAVISLLEHNPL